MGSYEINEYESYINKKNRKSHKENLRKNIRENIKIYRKASKMKENIICRKCNTKMNVSE